MHPLLNRNLFLVKEHVGLFKAANNFDIFDPENGELILKCREPDLGGVSRLLRFTRFKRSTPFDILILGVDDEPVLRVSRGVAFLRSTVTVADADGVVVGLFRERLFSFGGAFDVQDPSGETLCQLKGKWTGWDFRFVTDGHEFARVAKKWAGVGKELLTTADNYMLEVSEDIPPESHLRELILGAVMCIDMVLKE